MTDPKDNNLQNAADEKVGADTANSVQSVSEVEHLKSELEQAKAESANNYEQFLRAQAELANQRRRAEKQVEDAHKYAVQKFVESLVPVIDSLEMGLMADGDLNQIREGMQLTLKQFENVMEKFKIEAVGKPGEPFNPEHHQAMSFQRLHSATPFTST